MEVWGRGISSIFAECEKAGMPKPEFRIDPLFVTLGQISVQQLQHPSQSGADKEQKSQYESKVHVKSPVM